MERMKTALRDLQSNLSMAQEWMKRAMDKKRRTEDDKVGDDVVLSTANLRTYCPHIPQKIKARWIGPLHIIKAVSPVAVGLDLPPDWRIHLIFHVSNSNAMSTWRNSCGRLSHHLLCWWEIL